MDNLKELDFSDLTVIRIPVRYQGQVYLLCEASGDAGTRYRNAVFGSIKTDSDGNRVGIAGLATAELLLVQLCLYHAKEVQDANGGKRIDLVLDEETKEPVRVSESVVSGFPDRMLKELYKTAKDISELDDLTASLDSLQKQRDKIDKKIKKLKEIEQTSKNG